MRDLANRNKQDGTSENKGSREAGIDVHVGLQRRGFLNAELNDVAEAHGDFRLFVKTIHQ
jgi:hypothetical protein